MIKWVVTGKTRPASKNVDAPADRTCDGGECDVTDAKQRDGGLEKQPKTVTGW